MSRQRERRGKHSRKEKMAFLLQEIVDNCIAADKQDSTEVAQARRMLAAYWQSRDATHRDQYARERLGMTPGVGKLPKGDDIERR